MNLCNILKQIESILPQDTPAHKLKNSYRRNPYTILMVTLLSLRSKDEKTALVAHKLFSTTVSPYELVDMDMELLEEIIKPIGMYKQKAKTLKSVSYDIIKRFGGKVPDNKADLLSIKGIGEKTANIVLNNAFNQGIIAVDTHVHRICNLLDIVKTSDADETSKVLNSIVPKECKSQFNYTIVSFGQSICTISNPKCDLCSVFEYCTRYQMHI
jgi:endonuclease-3